MMVLKTVSLWFLHHFQTLQLGEDLINKWASKKDSYIPCDRFLAVPLSPSSFPISKAKGTELPRYKDDAGIYIHLVNNQQDLRCSGYGDVQSSLYYERGTTVLKGGAKIFKMALLFPTERITFEYLSSSLLWPNFFVFMPLRLHPYFI